MAERAMLAKERLAGVLLRTRQEREEKKGRCSVHK
jgi:hypothetical protein